MFVFRFGSRIDALNGGNASGINIVILKVMDSFRHTMTRFIQAIPTTTGPQK